MAEMFLEKSHPGATRCSNKPAEYALGRRRRTMTTLEIMNRLDKSSAMAHLTPPKTEGGGWNS